MHIIHHIESYKMQNMYNRYIIKFHQIQYTHTCNTQTAQKRPWCSLGMYSAFSTQILNNSPIEILDVYTP